jgi:hypothetical protein
MVDFVEAFFEVGVEDEFGFEANVIEDGFNGIVGTASGSETVRVWLEDRFPLRFQRLFDQRLPGAVKHRGDT